MMIWPGLAVAIGAGLPLADAAAALAPPLVAGLAAALVAVLAAGFGAVLALAAGAPPLPDALIVGAAAPPHAASSSEHIPAASQLSFLLSLVLITVVPADLLDSCGQSIRVHSRALTALRDAPIVASTA